MELFDAIAQRYSYRGPFTDAPVDRKTLEKIVRAGIQAPSGKNLQTTSFVIVDDPAAIAQIAKILDNKLVYRTARAMIACVTDPRAMFSKEDCAAAVENMLLAVTALGYAAVWVDGALRSADNALRIGKLLGVPADRTVQVLLPLGVPAEPGHPLEKLPFGRRAWFNRYGGAD
jgi:nitroreductase